MNGFIFEDSEIPDLVLETIIGFLVEMTPMEKWGEIRSVSKRWNRISKPVIKGAFERAWPRFIAPKSSTMGEGKRILEISEKRDLARLSENSLSIPRWALVEPISLHSVRESKKSIGVVLVPSCSWGIYVGCILVDSRKSKMFESEAIWSPSSEIINSVGFSMCAVGACSGTLFTSTNLTMPNETPARSYSGRLDKRDNEPYELVYNPGGRVTLTVNGKLHLEHMLLEDEMIGKFGDSAVIVFGASLENAEYTVGLRPRKASEIKSP